jgi:hypothetical protein
VEKKKNRFGHFKCILKTKNIRQKTYFFVALVHSVRAELLTSYKGKLMSLVHV